MKLFRFCYLNKLKFLILLHYCEFIFQNQLRLIDLREMLLLFQAASIFPLTYSLNIIRPFFLAGLSSNSYQWRIISWRVLNKDVLCLNTIRACILFREGLFASAWSKGSIGLGIFWRFFFF